MNIQKSSAYCCIATNLAVACFTIFATLSFSAPCFSQRPAWTSSTVKGAPTKPLPYETRRVFGNHTFDHPVELANAPGTNSMFLLEQMGKIYELKSEDSADTSLVADLTKHVDKLLAAYGLAFHPDFQRNREIYVCYKRDGDAKVGTVVSRFRLSSSQPLQLEADSEEILYTWLAGGHNGGSVKFGPDGYLYVSAGDSAAPFPPDPLKAGQDLSNLLSTIVRIDVDKRDGALPYGIPNDNPFVSLDDARPEIFAYGFRNPWRMAFDRETGDLWTGDVGWELWEMIYNVTSGGNYGWSVVEGPKSLHPNGKVGPTPILKPAASHSHSESRSITGGQVYYSDRLPDLQGAYIYGDHVTGRIWMLRKHNGQIDGPIEIARSPLQIICFGLHPSGELYIVDYMGEIHRLVRRQQTDTNKTFPRTLSKSGLFADTANQEFAQGVLPYEINAEPWMDGATAQRFVAIPGQQQIGVYKRGGGHANWDGKHRGSWQFPQDSVIGKTLSLQDRRVETQLLHFDGQAWQAYSYVWNADQTDATLADDKTQTVEIDLGHRKQPWLISNRGDCMVCHSNANDMLLAFKPNQLRRTANGHDDQLAYFEAIGLFEEDAPHSPVISDPLDESLPLELRARAYLHLNCAHCHRRNGGGAVAMSVLHDHPLDDAGLISEIPTQGTFGIEDARVVVPGDPYRSVLLYRFCKQGPGHMPKLGGLEVDQNGARLLHDWILSKAKTDKNSELQATAAKLSANDSDEELLTHLADTRQSMLASHAIREHLVSPSVKNKVLSAARQLPQTSKDLFESLVPYEERTVRLGANINVSDLLANQGNAERGKELFLSQNLSCKNCHAIVPGERSLGPNLKSLKHERYQRKTLLENLLQPSKEIAEQYRTHTVQTVDGEVFSGVAEELDGRLTIRDAQNKTHSIPLDDIEFRKESEVSLMPEKLLEELTLEQARDLIEFLHDLR